jgi:N-methylhydantoinase B
LVHSYSLRDDSGGAGRQRGGLGTHQVIEALSPINFQTRIEKVKNPPRGLEGGADAKGNLVAVRRAGDSDETVFPNGKVTNNLQIGDLCILRSGGGGGFGPPSERSLDSLREDVRQGYVTLEGAWLDYGVKFEPETLEVQERR